MIELGLKIGEEVKDYSIPTKPEELPLERFIELMIEMEEYRNDTDEYDKNLLSKLGNIPFEYIENMSELNRYTLINKVNWMKTNVSKEDEFYMIGEDKYIFNNNLDSSIVKKIVNFFTREYKSQVVLTIALMTLYLIKEGEEFDINKIDEKIEIFKKCDTSLFLFYYFHLNKDKGVTIDKIKEV